MNKSTKEKQVSVQQMETKTSVRNVSEDASQRHKGGTGIHGIIYMLVGALPKPMCALRRIYDDQGIESNSELQA